MEIPREYYRTFVLAGKAHFIAECGLTNNKVHFFVRRRKYSPDMYNIYIWNEGWYHVACFFSNNNVLHIYHTKKEFRNAVQSVFRFENAPKWLTINDVGKCPRCGRKITTKSIFGFGKECFKHVAKQLSMEDRDG